MGRRPLPKADLPEGQTFRGRRMSRLFLIILDFFIRVIAPSIWGVILFVIGITIILNIDEDKIEGRKDLKSGKRGSK